MLTLEQLRKPLTRAEALALCVDHLNGLGFDTTGWQDGRIQKTFLMTLSLMSSDFSEVVKVAADFGFNQFATGDILNEFSRSRFDQEKEGAVATKGPMTLRSVASVPYTIGVGALLVATSSGITFRNTTGGTIAAGSVSVPTTLVLEFEAVIKGASGNVGAGTANRMLTPYAGVTCANDQGSPWYTVSGRDEESDVSMRARNSSKWATFAVDAVVETLEHIARSHGAAKVKVHDQNPRGPGTVDVYASGEEALLGSAEMEAIQLAYSTRVFHTDATWSEPWPVGNVSAIATKHPATGFYDINVDLYHDGAVDGATIVARAREKMREFQREMPIGGWDYGPGAQNVILREDIIEKLQAVANVVTVVLREPATTITLDPLTQAFEGVWTFNPIVRKQP